MKAYFASAGKPLQLIHNELKCRTVYNVEFVVL